MKLYRSLILSGTLLLALAFLFTACSGANPTPVVIVITATPEDTPIPTESTIPVLEVVGPSETKTLTMEELQALPVTDGYAGIKSSTGKITPPIPMKGVALKDLAEFIGGMDETTGFNVVAEDGYSITFSYDQLQNGSFIAYDPATGAELKNDVELIAILAYEANGKSFDAKQDGALRLAIVSPELNQVTDGHWSVKWVNKLEVKSLGEEWVLHAQGAITKDIDRASIESCGAPQCHGASWIDEKDQEWAGVPLYYLVGSVDDEIEHEGPAFNRTLADAGYTIDVTAADGYTVTFDASRVQYNKHILVAYKVNESQLPEEYFPLRLVGDDLQKNEMIGAIAELKVDVEPLPATEVAATEPAATEAPAASDAEVTGSLVIVGAVDKPTGFTEADLRKLEVLKLTAEHPKKGKEDYEGVSLNFLLDLAGVNDGATTLVFIAADGYTSEVSLEEVRACTDCLLGFTNTPEKFKMVMPNLPSSAWAKDVVRIEVK
jgi:DMSO/TMAO reductase YedYZ molybdopterin-dependent catalytic subunit